jgi:hypothetical protein
MCIETAGRDAGHTERPQVDPTAAQCAAPGGRTGPRLTSELVNFSVTPAEEGASGFVTAVAAR